MGKQVIVESWPRFRDSHLVEISEAKRTGSRRDSVRADCTLVLLPHLLINLPVISLTLTLGMQSKADLGVQCSSVVLLSLQARRDASSEVFWLWCSRCHELEILLKYGNTLAVDFDRDLTELVLRDRLHDDATATVQLLELC